MERRCMKSYRTDYDSWPWHGHRDQAREDARYDHQDRDLYDRYDGEPKRAYAEEYDRERRRIEDDRREEERREEERVERRTREHREEARREEEEMYYRAQEEQRQMEEADQEDTEPEEGEAS